MSIRARIFAVIGVVVAAAFVQTLLVVSFERQRGEARDELERSLWRLQYRADLTRVIVELQSAQRVYLLTGQPDDRSDYQRLWVDYETTITLLRGQYANQTDLGERLTRLDTSLRDWHDTVSEPIMTAKAGQGAVPPELAEANAARLIVVKDLLRRFDDYEQARFAEQRRGASSGYLTSTMVTLAIPAVAIVMMLVLAAILARILLDPLAAVAQSARQISGGNFDVQLPPAGRDELGALVGAFGDMTSAVQRRQRELTDALAREREISHMYAALRTKAEQEHARLLATISTVPAALVILEAVGGRIVLQNRAADALIGREPEDDEARAAYWARFRATFRDGTPCPLQDWGPSRALRGEVIVGQELIVEQASGRRMPILVSAAPLRDDRGAITGAVAAFQDITNLYEVDRLKNEFVSVVSHELRTPLTSIKGALQLLVADATWEDQDQRTLVDVALSNAERLIRIINDILDISKIEAGKIELNPRPCEPAELVHLSLQSVEAIALGASVTIVSIVAPRTPKVMADPDRTVQAMVNLLSNALKYAPPKSEVVVDVQPAGIGQVRFAVTDKGRGIPQEKLGQLFQKFHQVDGADTRQFRGTGLGLAITKALIEMQGGQVFVESELGKGSTFAITIPTVG